jgi:hypothetical protein
VVGHHGDLPTGEVGAGKSTAARVYRLRKCLWRCDEAQLLRHPALESVAQEVYGSRSGPGISARIAEAVLGNCIC